MTMYQSWKDAPKDAWRWKNFSPRELACKGTGQLLVDEVALDALQRLRDELGRPLIVVSAYRSPQHNKRVGGAKNSYHLKGVAFDIRMDNHHPLEFELAARKCGFRGFGYYARAGFMHIDMGPSRKWGTPFQTGDTLLVSEPEVRERVTQSTTVQAASTQILAGVGGAVTALASLDSSAQYIVLGFAGVIILAAIWILRERIKKWADGVR